MMSPDGKWVWDGQKWVPVAVHESVFPAYSTATAASVELAASPVAETMVAPPVNPFAGPPSDARFVGPPPGPVFTPPGVAAAPGVVSPPIVAPAGYTAGGATPPWHAWASGGANRSRTLYLVAAFVAVAIGVVITISLVSTHLPFLNASNTGTPTPSPSPSGAPQLAVRSDSALAQRYINSNLNPHLALIETALTDENQACVGTLSFSCQQGLQAVDKSMPDALAAFDSAPPPCIARQVAKVKADLLGIQAAVKLGLKAFTDNNRSELVTAFHQYATAGRPYLSDLAAINKAQATCDAQPAGP